MELTTEEFEPIEDVTEEDLREVLETDGFGGFAILAESETSFIQTASDWQPGDACKQFMADHGSDPWILEYHDGKTNKHFRAKGHKTLDEVIDAFCLYLLGDDAWRHSIDWQKVEL